MKQQSFQKFIIGVMMFFGGLVYAQTVTGTVSDATGPLPGVNIIVKGTTNGTQTGFEGDYQLDNLSTDDVIVYSYVGYVTQEVIYTGQTEINITLEEDSAQLDEVVLVGYGSVRKKDATGAVASVKPEDFNKGVQVSADQLIQGRVAGVNVTTASGEPGAGASINIRGASSIRSGNGPLIVVDGVPLSGGSTSAGADAGIGTSAARNPLNFINPADIASMDILKDASATAIYGSRGANGVILITTKRGRAGEGKLSYSTTFATSTITNEYDLLNGDQYVNARIGLDGGVASDYDLGARVNAFDEIIRTGNAQTHDLSYTGGSDTGDYRFALGYFKQEGIIENSGLERITGNVTLNQRFFEDRLKLSAKVILSSNRDNAAAIADNIGAEGDLISSALRWNPTRPFRNDDGSYVQISNNQRNPLALLDYYYDVTETTRAFANMSAELKIVEGLTYKFNIGLDRSLSTRRIGQSRLLGVDGVSGLGRADVVTYESESTLFEHTFNYKKELSENLNLDAVVGYSYQNFKDLGQTTVAQGFAEGLNDERFYVENTNFATSFPLALQDSFSTPESELQSFFGRVNLNLYDKFLVTATLRADGASNFVGSNQYGYFPSAAFAWQLHKEDFIPEAFDDLKLRVGWGITGNREFPNGLAQNQANPGGGVEQTGNAVAQSIIGNPDLKWETTTQYNLGLDFAFLDNRLRGSIDYFYKQTDDLLFRFRTVQPAPDAFTWQNLTELQVVNSGVELALDAIIIDNEDFRLNANVNVSFLENRVENVAAEGFEAGIRTGNITGQGLSNESAQLLFDDQPLYAFYLPIFEGFDSNGNSVFRDVNGDGVGEASLQAPGQGDRTFVGDPNPDVLVGFQTNMTYKNWDLSIIMNGAFGHQIYDNTATALFNAGALSGGGNVTSDIVGNGEASDNPVTVSTRYLYDADFMRLSNLTLGYNFNPDSLPEWISSARLFFTGQNLFVITGYDGFDPEVNISKEVDDVPSFGIDFTSYPRARTFSLGLSVNF
ncbi:SusC/RagA family TonB-linked outer membrane protein [Winogradskyella sp.]|uniref:SusC/RagA family TonB-linked outer membrane protein n=1 Tax=Winogradskyella sp. TaxID=1883156 RepID=UPI003BAA316A